MLCKLKISRLLAAACQDNVVQHYAAVGVMSFGIMSHSILCNYSVFSDYVIWDYVIGDYVVRYAVSLSLNLGNKE